MNDLASYYKYRSLYQIGPNGEKEPHPFTQSIFEKAEIYYAAPKDFNDPFDCHLKLHADDSTDEEWEAYCDHLFKDNKQYISQLDEFKKNKLWNKYPIYKEQIGKTTLEVNSESSLFCLSRKGNSIPMFSYYADEHRGIATEFQFTPDKIPCGYSFADPNDRGVGYQGHIVFEDVEYANTFPELNYHRLYGKTQLVQSLIFTKHHEWKHEEEFRIFRRGIPPSKVQFDKKLLTRVIFGCRTTSEDMDLVRGWVEGWPSDVIFSRTETASDRFELKISDIYTAKAT